MKRVAVIMGSSSDLAVVSACTKKLEEFGIPYEMRIMSAHRTPADVQKFAESARDAGFGVIIAAAGMAAHLAGFIAANTILPVIGIPISSGALSGFDALLATIQMPPGVPVAAVAVDGAVNAAVLAVQILAAGDEVLSARLDEMKRDMAVAVRLKDEKLQSELI